MVFLQSHGVSTTYAVKIYKQYGDKSIDTVTHNPYQLATDIYGIGFLTADKIARNLGVPADSEFRYCAGLVHALSEAAEDGHCYLPQTELIESVIKLLTTDTHQPTEDAIAQTIKDMALKDELIRERDAEKMLNCYKPTYFYTEQNLAQLVRDACGGRSHRLSYPISSDIPRVRAWLERFSSSRQVSLSPEQQQAVETAAYSRFTVITGGPGVGKTFCTSTIVSLWKAMGKSIALAAPTGRAAQRLGEMTGLEAKTIHRLLEFDPKTRSFKCDCTNPLPHSAIIVDEASMLDLFLAYSLVDAVSKNAQLLLVGDIDQLPSVGAGNVLADLINSRQVPVVRLTKVFRQAASSKIITASHLINRGQYPNIESISDTPESDCLWHGGGLQPEHGVQAISELITDFIPKLGFNPASDVQVLCPMSRGLVGTRNLNSELKHLPNKLFYPVFILTLFTSFCYVLLITDEFQDWSGAYTAFGQNFVMSILFIDMLIKRHTVRGQSIFIAIFKMIGTLLASVGFYLNHPTQGRSLLFIFMYTTIFVSDLIYVVMIAIKIKKFREKSFAQR